MVSMVIDVDATSDGERREVWAEDDESLGGGGFDDDGEYPSASDDVEVGGGGGFDGVGGASLLGALVQEIASNDDSDDDDDDVDDDDDESDGVDRILDDVFNSIAYANYLDGDNDEEEEVDCPVHRVLCGACDAIVSERSQCVNLLADARQCLYSTDIPCFASIAADHTAVLPIETCECIAEKVHCNACTGQVGYHVTQVCAFCDRSGHNGHFWIFQSEKVKANAIEADAAAAAADVDADAATDENEENTRSKEECGRGGKKNGTKDKEVGVSEGGAAQLAEAAVGARRSYGSSRRATGEIEAATAAAARRTSGSIGEGRGGNTEDDVHDGEVANSMTPLSNTTTTEGGGSGGGDVGSKCDGDSDGGDVKPEGHDADDARADADDATVSCGVCDRLASPRTPPLLLWSALPYNGAPIATFRLLASTRLSPPSNIVCSICASVMHQPVRLRPCGHRGVCWGCARREVDARGVCPFDRRALVAGDLLPDQEARAEVATFLAAAREAAAAATDTATVAAAAATLPPPTRCEVGVEVEVDGDVVGERNDDGAECGKGSKRRRELRDDDDDEDDGDGHGETRRQKAARAKTQH